MKKALLAASAFGLAWTTVPALADDRPPNANERAAIETSLKAAGYNSWEEIEYEDGLWEVDDARKPGSAVEYDLKLNPESYAIVSTRED